MILPPAVDYTDRDFEALRARVFDLIRSVFPNWTDDSVANFANLLIEGWCFVGDVLGYYEDRLAREGRFAWATQRRSMIALCKLIGYQLPGASAAGCDLVLTVTNPAALTGHVRPAMPSTPVTVATRTVVSAVRGEIMDPIDINVGGGITTLTVAWEHSVTQGPYSVASTGRPDQQVLLPFGPFLDDGSEVFSTPTQPVWTRVDTFLFSGPTDCHYRIEVDQNDLATVIYGDGRNGAVPVGDVSYRWRTGGGVAGNVEQNSLTKFVTNSFVDDLGHTAEVTVTNPAKAEGGFPREEVEGARVNAPLSFRTSDRTISRDDFEINALRVPGVGRALMLTSNEDPGIDENTGDLYVLPKSGGIAPQAMLDDVWTMCSVTYPHTVTFQLETRSVVYLDINVYAVVWLREGADRVAARAAIQAGLEDWFEPMLASGAPNPTVDFGWNYKDEDGNPAGEIAWSDLFDVVRDVAQVRKVGSGSTEFTLNALHDDVSIPNHMFPRLGTVTVIDGHTGTAF